MIRKARSCLLWKKMEICKKCIPYFRRTWYNVREGKARNQERGSAYLISSTSPFLIPQRATRAGKIFDFPSFAVTCAEPAGENFHTAQYPNTIIRRKEEYYDREDQ